MDYILLLYVRGVKLAGVKKYLEFVVRNPVNSLEFHQKFLELVGISSDFENVSLELICKFIR